MAQRKNLKDGYQQAIRETGVKEETRIAVTSDGLPLDIALQDSNTGVEIFNVAVATAGVEVSQALPADTKRFILRSRNRSEVKLSYTNGESGTKYLTIVAGATYEDTNFYSAQTIYFQTSKNSETIEIIAFTK